MTESTVQRIKIANLKRKETKTITLAIVSIRESRDALNENYRILTLFSDEDEYILLEEFDNSIISDKYKLGDSVNVTVHDIKRRCGPYPNQKNIELDPLHISEITYSATKLNPHRLYDISDYMYKKFKTQILTDIHCEVIKIEVQENTRNILYRLLTFI